MMGWTKIYSYIKIIAIENYIFSASWDHEAEVVSNIISTRKVFRAVE